MSESRSDHFKDFTIPDYSDWLTAAREELQGDDPEEKLAWQVADLQGHPYYTSHHAKSVIASTAHVLSWKNIPLVTAENEAVSNTLAHTHLNQGGDGVIFSVQQNNPVSLEKLLKKIEWPYCTISFLVDTPSDSFAEQLKSYIGKAKYPLDELTGSLFTRSYPQHPQTINNLIHNLVSLTNFDCLGIYIKSGQPTERIASALAMAVQEIEHLASSGISKPVSVQRIAFAMETGTDFFIEIATLKALRLLWFQVARAYGLSDYQPADLCIHAISSPWAQEQLGPHSNMLKSTTAAMAGIIGGCTALTVMPENESDQQMVRIARNVSTLLKEESRLDKVADPLAGSYYLECLTSQIIEKAWASFQRKMNTP